MLPKIRACRDERPFWSGAGKEQVDLYAANQAASAD
jgi:hypothetical protein